ncbi:MAG: hypothetical protein AABX88_02395 [Nanoarchaeota archaeon]
MSYTEFSTENADYVLQLGNHIKKNDHNVFGGIDGLVVEIGNCDFKEFIKKGHPQMDMPIQLCKENKIPIFGTDIYSSFFSIIRDLPLDPLLILSLPIALYYGYSKKRVNKFLGGVASTIEFFTQSPITTRRDAINARKIEEYIVPKIISGFGKQRPKLGLVFGAAHMGLKEDLKYQFRRNLTIWNWRNLNFGKNNSFVKENLNKVYEANYNCDRWIFETHETDLFE